MKIMRKRIPREPGRFTGNWDKIARRIRGQPPAAPYSNLGEAKFE
jgi:hypothetical protein